ncbi:SDR family NAD(P)-dependent oxidoreductase [Rhizobium sp. BT-175]|uniref:SDR family NAD(P)-dependent oxidoreductase n=1 Tax=Rhizobium sp. BT-175 TaxID=2986929 RepID=UPI002235B808|nr:SDR family NAD(P)-dependent oxidoreductase [Rhizobium sp. BT-175]MCV9947579.1 SDR family NAD(P)-dependent oxidoreductase [Rhizobium sp. BT-175]
MEATMGLVTLVTGASSGFGNMIARALAGAGYTVYASMRGTEEKNADKVRTNATFAKEKGVDLRSIELDVQDDRSIASAIDTIIKETGRIDLLVQNAGHMVYGPSEAFTPEQLAEIYDVNVLGAQRVNRAVLPHMRAARSGLLIWISSSSVAGGVPPLLGPYFAAKAAMDALAVCYAKELTPFGIETSIVVPGAFTTGTNHFANAGAPEDKDTASTYVRAYPDNFMDRMKDALASTVPEWADPGDVGRAVLEIVGSPYGKRPLRVHVDPANDGAAVAFAVTDRVRGEFLHRIGFPELLHPTEARKT